MDIVARRAIWLAVLVFALASCTQLSSPEKQLSVAVSDAATATTTSRLAVSQLGQGRTSAAVAKTTLTDMLTEIDKASASVGAVSVKTSKQRSLRLRAVASIDAAKVAILDAEDSMHDVRGSAPLRRSRQGLGDAAKQLNALARKLPEPR